MDKGKTCKTCCSLNESINEMGRCETCQARIEKKYIERLKRKKGGSKRELTILTNSEKEIKDTEKQTQRR